MRWMYTRTPKPPRQLHEWHLWFAWHPVRIVNQPELRAWAWLERVERRLFWTGYEDDPRREYRPTIEQQEWLDGSSLMTARRMRAERRSVPWLRGEKEGDR